MSKKKKLKIDVNDITLHFYPSEHTNPEMYDAEIKSGANVIFRQMMGTASTGTTTKYSRRCCDIEFKIKFDKKGVNTWNWERKNVDVKTAKKIYETAVNKSVCAVNLASSDPVVKEFAETKSTMFLDIVPKTNFTQYELWLKLLERIEKYNERAEKALAAIWKEGDKEQDLSTQELAKKLEELGVTFSNNENPLEDWVKIQHQPLDATGFIFHTNGGGTMFSPGTSKPNKRRTIAKAAPPMKTLPRKTVPKQKGTK